MIDKQEAEGPSARKSARPRGALAGLATPGLAALGLVAALAGCTTVSEMTQSPEQAAAEQPQRVATEGSKDKFPNLASVPDEPRAATAPEDRERVMAEMTQDHAQARFSDPPPMITAAAPDPFATAVVISGDGVVTNQQAAGVPLVTAAGGGQLAAIIFFGHGSSDLDGRDRNVLRDVAALLKQRGGSLRIVGHASSRTQNTTPDEHQIANFDMSLIRAEAVQDELLALGVAAGALRAEALGDAEPVYHEFMPSGEAGNRRVEIFLEN